MNRQNFAMALCVVAFLLYGSHAAAKDYRQHTDKQLWPVLRADPFATGNIRPASWDISISIGHRGGHRHYDRGHGHHRPYRHGYRGHGRSPRYYGYYHYPPYRYRDYSHPDYGFRSYGYKSHRYDSNGNYHYKGGLYRYRHPSGRGYGSGYGFRH